MTLFMFCPHPVSPVYRLCFVIYLCLFVCVCVCDRNKLRSPSGRSNRSAKARVRHMGQHGERSVQNGFHWHDGSHTSTREHGQSKNRVIELISPRLRRHSHRSVYQCVLYIVHNKARAKNIQTPSQSLCK